MNEFVIRVFRESDRDAVKDLWRVCNLTVPQNDPDKDINLKVHFQPELFFVGEYNGKVAASIMAGYDGHRGHMNYVSVYPEYQRKGIGKQMVLFVLSELQKLGCPKVNISVRSSNEKVTAFYRKIGFAEDPVIGMGYRF
jgi:ribosomal protein S18 acetylase RimI-like enzyme